jgi:hypothetical protein
MGTDKSGTTGDEYGVFHAVKRLALEMPPS